ncbi:DUF5302 domain-containing protein [Saccharomonospora sp. NPDC046836]|uniref:DUF5302 domain-containing protein n=1 Tax=Saccharomonospora sp. NPDC046836 TaxID=3156921 RepID=UPI0033DC6BA9
MTDSEPSQDNNGSDDDVKRRFREALERKQAKAKAGSAHESVSSKASHAHGPAAHKRTFRRKSG